MPDRVFYPIAAFVVIVLIWLASVYPQGQGAKSPKPFGHATWASTHQKKPTATTPGAPPSDKAKLKGPF